MLIRPMCQRSLQHASSSLATVVISDRMKASLQLLSPTVRLTLFTRVNCSLCDSAKLAVAKARKQLEVGYEEIDIMQEGQRHWRDQYEFDVPVVCAQGSDGLQD